MARGRVAFRAAAQASFRGFQKYDLQLDAPSLARDRIFVTLYAVHHNYPRLNYYVPGPDSQKTGRSNFRLEDTAVDGTAGFRLVRGLSLVGSAGYLLNQVGPGTDSRFISADRQFKPTEAVGIDRQAEFFRSGVYLAV